MVLRTPPPTASGARLGCLGAWREAEYGAGVSGGMHPGGQGRPLLHSPLPKVGLFPRPPKRPQA